MISNSIDNSLDPPKPPVIENKSPSQTMNSKINSHHISSISSLPIIENPTSSNLKDKNIKKIDDQSIITSLENQSLSSYTGEMSFNSPKILVNETLSSTLQQGEQEGTGIDKQVSSNNSQSLLAPNINKVTAQDLYNQKNFKEGLKLFKDENKKGKLEKIPVNKLPKTKENIVSGKDIVHHLFDLSQKSHLSNFKRGFCIGEINHKEDGAKQFLIDYLDFMKKEYNLGLIGIEGFTYEQNELLKQYIFPEDFSLTKDEQKKVEKKIKQHIRFFHSSSNSPSENSSIMKLLELAKELKIQVVGIDPPQQYQVKNIQGKKLVKCLPARGWNSIEINEKGESKPNHLARCVLMNYSAMQTLKKEINLLEENKTFVCLMGVAHLNRLEEINSLIDNDIPGVADALGCPSLIISGSVSPNSKGEIAEIGITKNKSLRISYRNIQQKSIKDKDSQKEQNVQLTSSEGMKGPQEEQKELKKNKQSLISSIYETFNKAVNAVLDEIDTQ